MPPPPDLQALTRAIRRRKRALLKLAVLVVLIAAANVAAGWLTDALQFELRPSNEGMVHRMIMVSAAAYAVLIAVPFVPGVEIGLTLIAALGPPIVFLVYVCTLAGLTIGYVVGRLVSLGGLIRLLDDLRLRRASRLLTEIEPLDRSARLAFLAAKAPSRLVPFLLRHRYVALAVVINVPGNIVLGGGGGIALMAGASGLYAPPGYLLTIAIAVSPVPLAVLLLGPHVLAG